MSEKEERASESRSTRRGIGTRDNSAPMWVLVIGILVLGALALWMFRPQAPVAQPEEAQGNTTVNQAEVAQCETTAVGGLADKDSRQVFEDEIEGEYSLTVVEYVKGWDSYGKMVQGGTKVIGPALIKPDPNTAHGIGVLVGAEYILKNDSVVWLLRANDEGVRSQSMFFSTWEEIAPRSQ